MAAADSNGDGQLDIILCSDSATPGTNAVGVLLGDGKGHFGASYYFGAGIALYGSAVGDFNGDGKPDVAIANRLNNSVSILKNQSN